MQVYLSEKSDGIFPLKDTAVALGTFDAIHKGHKAIIENAVKYAKENNLISVVYLFKNTPREIIEGICVPSINTFEKRLKLLEALGVDIVVAEVFTMEYSELSAEGFVKDYLIKRLGAKYVVTGDNYHFGKKGEGDAKLLSKLAEPFGIKTSCIPCVEIDGETVSSTRIRKCIIEGNVEEIEKLLGRYYSVRGVVTTGNRIGREMNFPTANISIPKNCISPKYGVYITKTIIDGKEYPSVTNVGGKPTVEENAECIETHVIDFNDYIYEKEIQVEFLKYIRGIIKFSSIDELKNQIEKDKEFAKEYFKSR